MAKIKMKRSEFNKQAEEIFSEVLGEGLLKEADIKKNFKKSLKNLDILSNAIMGGGSVDEWLDDMDENDPKMLNKITQAIDKINGVFDSISRKVSEGSLKEVEDTIWVNGTNLRSLENKDIPPKISDNFWCNHNQLTSLKGGPKTVGGHYHCNNNKLTSLKFAPKTIGEDFACTSNKLTSLEGGPKTVGGRFDCGYNQLTSLKGGPKTVGGHFGCTGNKLTSLEGIPKKINGNVWCSKNPGPNGDGFTEKDVRAVCDVKGKIFV